MDRRSERSGRRKFVKVAVAGVTGAALAGAQAAEAHADLGVREHEIGVDRQAHRNEYLKAREQQAVTQGNIRTYQQGTDAVVDTSRALWSVRNLTRYW